MNVWCYDTKILFWSEYSSRKVSHVQEFLQGWQFRNRCSIGATSQRQSSSRTNSKSRYGRSFAHAKSYASSTTICKAAASNGTSTNSNRKFSSFFYHRWGDQLTTYTANSSITKIFSINYTISRIHATRCITNRSTPSSAIPSETNATSSISAAATTCSQPQYVSKHSWAWLL